MKKEYQYLIVGAVISAAVLMGMGIAKEDKQVTEGRYQFIDIVGDTLRAAPEGGTATNLNLFYVLDSQTGTINYVDVSGQTIVFPFAATKAE